MFNQSSIKQVSQPVLDSEKLQSSPSTLDIVVLQKLAVALDECNEESLLGGCFSCEDKILTRLNAPDELTKTSGLSYGIRFIPIWT
jgi:hypothetical protein